MKRYFVLLFNLCLCAELYSQVDSSAQSFFPHHIGDIWEYDNINSRYRIELTKDSTVANSSYLYYDNGDVPYYEIDSSLNVIQYPTIPKWMNIRLNLKAKQGESWISEGTTIIGRVDTLYWDFLFGVLTQVKEVGYYFHIQINDSISYLYWRNTDYYAAGFGYFLSQYDIAPPDEQLLGCIIDGVKYGTLTNVLVSEKKSIPLFFTLYPTYPNPFNPSTTISYQLSARSFVTVKVYDILGKEVSTLMNREQERGVYKINFTPKNISSGIYLVRMTAGQFTQTNKIIYSK